MARRRSRHSRSSASSSSSSSSSSSDSEERRERKEERRQARQAKRLDLDAALEKKREELEREKKVRSAQAVMAGIPYAIKDCINDYTNDDDDDDDEEDGEEGLMEDMVEIRAEKASNAPEGVVDMSKWSDVEKYLREYFQVHATVEKVALVLKYYKKDSASQGSPSL